MIKSYQLPLLFVLVSALSSFELFASPQSPDYIIYGKDTITTYNLILEQYLQRLDTVNTEKLFDLSFRAGATLNCWRGYQAIYKIDNDSLFLAGIISCGERRSGQINKSVSLKKMKTIFGNKLINDRVFIDWFSGDINFPLNNKLLRWDGVFYAIYEKEMVINIINGKSLRVEAVENYIDDPGRINRKNKNKISAFLFKKIKKIKWKSDRGFNCSDKYLITIDENGIVSKVRMLYTAQEINKYHERDEYNFCINNIFTALKSLKFDIIKDKGKPISEDIYIQIWVEDNGKIENWTYP